MYLVIYIHNYLIKVQQDYQRYVFFFNHKQIQVVFLYILRYVYRLSLSSDDNVYHHLIQLNNYYFVSVSKV